MRIAHVITRLILGGAQENTLLTCDDLLNTFHDEVLLVTGPPLGPEGSLMEQAAARGVPVTVIDELRRPIHAPRDLVSYFKLKRVLREFRPDVVHTHSAKGGILGRAAAKALRVPAVVHTVHGAPFHAYQPAIARWTFRACERWAAPRCDAFISVADAMTDLMVDAGVAPRDRFTTIYSGMEVEPFLSAGDKRERVRGELGYQADQVVVTKIARLFRLKGHDDVIEAARRIVPQHDNVRFLFIGDGVLRESLSRRIDALGLSDRFHFAGLVPPESVPGLLAASDVVVHTSLREGLARALPQALLSAKPVVSYDVDGAREVVIPGETGHLVPPRDVDALTDALTGLISDPHERERMGQEGRRRFVDLFRHERMTEQIRALYERVLSDST